MTSLIGEPNADDAQRLDSLSNVVQNRAFVSGSCVIACTNRRELAALVLVTEEAAIRHRTDPDRSLVRRSTAPVVPF